MIKKVSLENFRNHKKTIIESSKYNVIIGQNGIGKTNFLEALFVGFTGKTWRGKKEEDLINWDNNYCRIEIELSDETRVELIFLSRPKLKKVIKINQIIKKPIDLIGNYPFVLFSPENLAIISGSPAERRRFLDILLSQLDKKYAENLIKFHKVLKNRNALLANIALGKSQISELDFWNHKISESVELIIKKRINLIKEMNENISDYYQKISGKNQKLEIKYAPSYPIDEKYLNYIKKEINKEIKYQTTLFGPHRDDVIFYLDGRIVKPFVSRGEARSIVLACKKVELDVLAKKTNQKPILLLDDIFSELDEKRRDNIIALLEARQIFFTSATNNEIPQKIMEKAKIIKL